MSVVVVVVVEILLLLPQFGLVFKFSSFATDARIRVAAAREESHSRHKSLPALTSTLPFRNIDAARVIGPASLKPAAAEQQKMWRLFDE